MIATFILSTGRCGTQWLAHVLASALGERAEVRHEPLGDDYAPREMLGAGDDPASVDPELASFIDQHADDIERVLESRDYLECGHPLWSTLPYLLRRFAGRARVIHLVRHPVPTAISWLTHSAYIKPFATHIPEKVLLSPFDDGVHFVSYRERWATMTPYEKALFYWLEVNAFGVRLEAEGKAPWLRVRFEDLVRGDGLARVLAFANAEAREVDRPGMVDQFRYICDTCDPSLIAQHPDVMELARTLGYDPLGFDIDKLRSRYFA